ncbi:MAG: type II toxin-antitoxin system death-on-curing family toxin [Gemmatimonadaceae bacterium]|nr:type II toxin-antitoxin system death-on-curing family toxin [Gemmatimonadaceae bacterium]
MTTEPRWLTDVTVLAIHAQQIERFGGAHGGRGQHVVLFALARPQQRWNYDASADTADLTALYLVGLSQAQGFVDGNKRTGLACAPVFLALNGAALHVDGSELYALTVRVATNQTDDVQVAAYIRQRLA